ncbi:hypothetical protein F2Q69_00006471 [Brassica cretica]|uniref:DUF1985 domain-containing protein n=1 Tax=Brassica cretica TaxID=69181 RepID=A0A8S9PGK1_BRACR|nr:hypothetical protein F2Q69_00006471 [Brassica cretica]
MISTPVGHARSSLRKIFNLPACQHPVSSYPLIFGLQEFGTITGLPRGDFPVDYEPVSNKKSEVGKDPYRKKLIGKKKLITIAELCHKLESESQMTWWRKILLKLIIIVDDVFIPHKESSFKTTYFIKPSKLFSWKGNDPIRTLVRQLKHGSLRLHRFPLSLQFLAFHAFKKFQSKIHAPFGQSSIMDFDDIHLPQHRPINLIDILCMEAEPNNTIPNANPLSSANILLNTTALPSIDLQSIFLSSMTPFSTISSLNQKTDHPLNHHPPTYIIPPHFSIHITRCNPYDNYILLNPPSLVTSYAVYDTSAHPKQANNSVDQNTTNITPNNPTLHSIMFDNVNINDPISLVSSQLQ